MVNLKIHTFLKCIYYRAFTVPWSLAIFQANELHTIELEALSPSYTLPEQNYKSLIMAKIAIE